MSKNMKFSPESWDTAAASFTEAGSGFASSASGKLGGMTADSLGCNNGGTLADAALATVVPTLMSAMTETAKGIGSGVGKCAQMMTATATAYRNTERYATDAAKDTDSR